MKTLITTLFIAEAFPIFLLLWLNTDFDTAYEKFEEIAGLVLD